MTGNAESERTPGSRVAMEAGTSTSQVPDRRLAAVLAADVVGYSRLMGADEEDTIKTWWDFRRQIIDPEIKRHDGRIVKLTGDGFLAEFPSATAAVNAAYTMQQGFELHARKRTEDRRMRFRMGINVGDIFRDRDDIYGDNVNIAARLEGIAEPGAVVVSQSVFEQVKRTVHLVFHDMGPVELKNIAEPVRAFSVLRETEKHSCMSGESLLTQAAGNRELAANSLVVLPFKNFSGDPDQEYFADGFTEDLTAELSRFADISVLSRNTSFALKDQALDPLNIRKQLGVMYCLEGSVRKMGQRVRITAQLIDSKNSNHVWADKSDCALDDLFDTQDQLARAIAAKVVGKLEVVAIQSAKKKKPSDMAAYDCLMRGLEHHRLAGVTRESAEEAMHWLDMAIEKDPNYGRAYAWRACAIGNRAVWTGEEFWDEAVRMSNRALELDDNEAECHRIAGSIALYDRAYDKTEYHFRRALELNPSNAYILGRMGDLYIFLGEPEKALEYAHEATRLDPSLPPYCRETELIAHYLMGNHLDAIKVASEFLRTPLRCRAYVVAARSHLDDRAALQSAVDDLLACDPDFNVDAFMASEFYSDADLANRVERDLRKSGLA